MTPDDNLSYHPDKRLYASLLPTSTSCSLSYREARATTSTQLSKMKLYPTSLMSHHSPEPYTTKNPDSAWRDQIACSKCMKGLRFITIIFLPLLRLLVHHDDVIDWVLTIMKTDDYLRQVEQLSVIDPLTAYDEIKHYPGLFDMQQVTCRITTEADICKRQLCRRGMYPICDSPVLLHLVLSHTGLYLPSNQ